MERKDFIVFKYIPEVKDPRMSVTGRISVKHILPSQTVVFDEKTGRERLARYCRGEQSIFRDEQNSWARPSSVKFDQGGILMVGKQETALIDYIRAQKSFGTRIVEMNNDKRVSQAVETVGRSAKATAAVFDMDINKQVYPMLHYFGLKHNDGPDEARLRLYYYAKKNPESFLESLGSPIVDRIYEVGMADNMGIIEVKASAVNWTNAKMIIPVPASENPYEYFAQFTFSEEGKSVWGTIKETMESKGEYSEEKAEESYDAKAAGVTAEEFLAEATAEDILSKALELGVIVRNTSWYEYPDIGEKFRKKELIDLLSSPTDILGKMKMSIIKEWD